MLVDGNEIIIPESGLTLELIRNRLSLIGKHPLTQKLCFLRLDLSSCNLYDIKILKDYQKILYLDVSDNNISNLSSIESISSLVQLNASNNTLTSCLDFFPLECTKNNKWISGHLAIGSQLTIADISHNNIEVINDLSHHKFLEVLILHHNKIIQIEGISNLSYLKVLDLSYNDIIEISGLDYLPIQELNLAGNRLTSIQGLSNLKNLTSLNLSNNNISSLGHLSVCHELSYLDASCNQLKYIRQVEFLCELRWLKVLKLYGNPCAEKDLYRNRVIYRLPKLTLLDTMEISALEKVQSMNIYGVKGGDIEEQMNTFYKYFKKEDASFIYHGKSIMDDEFSITASQLYDEFSITASQLYDGIQE